MAIHARPITLGYGGYGREWRAAGLNVPGGVKAQLAAVEERLVVKIVGKLAAVDAHALNERLRRWLNLLFPMPQGQ